MQIRELSPDELDYVSVLCVDPFMPQVWRKAMTPAMQRRQHWLRGMMGKGLRVSAVLEEADAVLQGFGRRRTRVRELVIRGRIPKGLIECVPIEFAPEPVRGRNSFFIDCLWVLPRFWHGGVARNLMERAIANAKPYGGLSVLAYEDDKWFDYFDYMPAGFFRKFGFREVCRDRTRVLLHLDLGGGEKPTLIQPKTRIIKSKKPVLDLFYSSQCPWSRFMVDKTVQRLRKYDLAVNVVNADDRKTIEEYGIARGVCINGKPAIARMASWKEIEQLVKTTLSSLKQH